MALKTGTLILSKARLLAQDTATSPAVSDANALILLNDVLLRFCGDVSNRSHLVAASVSGLSFSANEAIKQTTLSGVDYIDELLAAHPSDTNAANTVPTPALELKTVDWMLDAYGDTGDGSLSGGGTEWQAWAWERVSVVGGAGTQEQFRVYVYPALSAERHLTLRVSRNVTIAALTDTPDLSLREADIVARLLAWEMARLHTRDEAFLAQILAPIPEDVLKRMYRSASLTGNWGQGGMKYTGALDR